MKKVFKVFLSLMLVASLLIPSVSAFAATEKTNVTTSEQQVSTVQNEITSLENNLKANNTDVISELKRQTSDYQTKLTNVASTEERSKIGRLITATENLIRNYSNYKQSQSSDNAIRSSSNSSYSAAVAAVVAYFEANNYNLSAELLTHASDNDTAGSEYDPVYGYLCGDSPVTLGIWNSSGHFSGSGLFPKNAFASAEINDLYYAIHKFNYKKHISSSGSYLEISDKYDYAQQSEYTGVAGVAVQKMYEAQQAGVIVPYQIIIDVSF